MQRQEHRHGRTMNHSRSANRVVPLCVCIHQPLQLPDGGRWADGSNCSRSKLMDRRITYTVATRSGCLPGLQRTSRFPIKQV
eukprot:scaffold193246_cov20-Prasinocladus_malaysianus.AAC.1